MSSQEVFTTRKGRTLGVILSDCDFKYKVTCEWNTYEQVKTDTDSIDIDTISGNYSKAG